MPLRTIRAAVSVLAGLLILSSTACDREAAPATVTAVLRDAAGAPLAGAHASLRRLGDSAVTATTDSSGRVRLSLRAHGPGLAEFARTASAPRQQRVIAPLLLEPGTTVALEVRLAGDSGTVRYPADGPPGARWGRAVELSRTVRRRHYAAYRAWVAQGRPGALDAGLAPFVDTVRAALAVERDPAVRSAWWRALLTVAALGEAVPESLAERALREIPPAAAVWSWDPRSMAREVRAAALRAEGVGGGGDEDAAAVAGRRELANRRAAVYIDRVIAAHADATTRPAALLGAMELALATGRREDATGYYQRLEAEYPESEEAQLAAREAPGRRLEVGAEVPAVPLPALDSAAPPILPRDLTARATLLDFWATWCTPCVAEMPTLQRAYERFHHRGFDIVSISFDASRADVRRFRRTHAMPWRQAFVGVEGLAEGDVSAAYGVTGLPAAFLVGPDGRILALERDLRGDRLEATLDRLLPLAAAP